MVSVVAALSKRKDCFDCALFRDCEQRVASARDDYMTHFADIFKYAKQGVRRSAGIVTHSGIRFGGLGSFLELEMTF
jgi:hypothetical protein